MIQPYSQPNQQLFFTVCMFIVMNFIRSVARERKKIIPITKLNQLKYQKFTNRR